MMYLTLMTRNLPVTFGTTNAGIARETTLSRTVPWQEMGTGFMKTKENSWKKNPQKLRCKAIQ